MNFKAYTLSKNSEWACIQVKASESEARVPVHLCCIIDTSGSMADENKLKNVKNSLYYLLDFLCPKDKISIITFSDTAKTFVNQAFCSEKETIRTQLSFIQTESSTNLSAGIIQAQETLLTDSNYKQGILLLTDGEANAGLVKTSDIVQLIHNTTEKFIGTTISCIGYGLCHNAELLQSISTTGRGSYYIVNNCEAVATVFGDVLGGLVTCIAQQVQVILPAGTEVKSRYATNTESNEMNIIIGDMTSGFEAIFFAKIPHRFRVSLKGYNLLTHEHFVVNSHVMTYDNIKEQLNAYAHYLRFEVIDILESPTLEKMDEYITKITEYKAENNHMLWDILIQQLKQSKKSFGHHDPYLRQTLGCLGLMRGISGENNAFSNAIQRQFSNQLSNQLSQNVDVYDDLPDLIEIPEGTQGDMETPVRLTRDGFRTSRQFTDMGQETRPYDMPPLTRS